MFIPSSYQKQIFDWIINGSGNGIINAVAGSGKTTTLVEAAKKINGCRLLFTSFNNHIVEELEKRLPATVTCKTIHSRGYSCISRKIGLRKIPLKESKYNTLCRNATTNLHIQLLQAYENRLRVWVNGNMVDEMPEAPPKPEFIHTQMEELVRLTQLTLSDASDISQMNDLVAHFTIDCPIPLEDISEMVQYILEEGEKAALEQHEIGYNDMIWLPHKWKLMPELYDWILVDEAQDLNKAQLNLLLKMAGNNTRMLFVGDPRQAIYGFAGADSRSFENIKELINAQEFSLPICYRCPTSVISLAKAIVPAIEEKEGAPEGEVSRLAEHLLIHQLRDGDLVLSRATEPLVKLCRNLIGNKKQATVRGKSIGKSLVKIIRAIEQVEGFSFENFALHLREYCDAKIRKLQTKEDTEKQIVDFVDQVNSIETCFNSYSARSVTELCHTLENLFREENAGIKLSTIHRAKGLEANRVFILSYDGLPRVWKNQKDWQFEQEKNLKYVAITRAKQSLFQVTSVLEE